MLSVNKIHPTSKVMRSDPLFTLYFSGLPKPSQTVKRLTGAKNIIVNKIQSKVWMVFIMVAAKEIEQTY